MMKIIGSDMIKGKPLGSLLFVWLVSLALFVPAQSAGKYEINWYTIDGGGGQSSGGPYILTGTIGQPDAAYSAGGSYDLLGGFWPGGPPCIVDFEDFARFAIYWMQSGSDLPADLYEDSFVDYDDLLEFANWWLCSCPYNWPLR